MATDADLRGRLPDGGQAAPGRCRCQWIEPASFIVVVLQAAAAEMALRAGLPIAGRDPRQAVARFAPVDVEAVTGFLFGDLVLAYAATWEDWTPLLPD